MTKFEDIFGKIKDIISVKLDINPDIITLDASFVYDLGADSIDSVSLVMAWEEAFNIDITEDIYDRLRTVRDVADYIDSVMS